MDIPHWISVQRSPHAFSTNDFKLLVLLVTLLGSIYNKCSAIISNLSRQKYFIITINYTIVCIMEYKRHVLRNVPIIHMSI